MSDLPRGNMGSDGLDPREFGCGIETNKKAIAWQKRAAFWRNKAIELGYKPVGEEQPEAIADKEMTHDQERKKFEAWCDSEHLWLGTIDGVYVAEETHGAWRAWQAATAGKVTDDKLRLVKQCNAYLEWLNTPAFGIGEPCSVAPFMADVARAMLAYLESPSVEVENG